MDLRRRLVAEALGSALLLATVIGSAIMGDRLAGGNAALALLTNSIATGGALVALILSLGPISGAHMNPLVSLAEAWRGRLPGRELPAYALAQVSGAIAGVALADGMFEEPILSLSSTIRGGGARYASEALATFGLLSVALGCARRRPDMVAFAVGGYVLAGYWFTSSMCFANPALTLARCFTGTVGGIRWEDAPGFIAAETLGAAGATLLFGWLEPARPEGPAVAREKEADVACSG